MLASQIICLELDYVMHSSFFLRVYPLLVVKRSYSMQRSYLSTMSGFSYKIAAISCKLYDFARFYTIIS